MNVNFILLLFSLIIIFGYIAELIFDKFNISDTLLLIILGFLIGPNVLNYIQPESLGLLAPFFTTFTLLFLMFEGSLKLDLKSFFRGFSSGVVIALFYFLLSSLAVTAVFHYFGFDLIMSLMIGFSLGGVSTSFIIPVLNQLNPGKEIRSVLTIEAAMTDVLAIVMALAIIELKVTRVFALKEVLSELASLFAVASIVGIIFGALWIFLEEKLVKDKDYMVTIGYVVLLYFLTEYLGGNGAIAALFYGMILTNSIKLRMFIRKIVKGENVENGSIKKIISVREKEFYDEISFFLKTFFFVYLGILLNVKNTKAILIGSVTAVALLVIRQTGYLFGFMKKGFKRGELFLINSLFARGIAPVAIVLMAINKGVLSDNMVIDSIYFTITATIILSSIMIFFYKRLYSKKKNIDK
ncbi:MAG: cation:proton antiporter [Acidobacteriota bacterium]